MRRALTPRWTSNAPNLVERRTRLEHTIFHRPSIRTTSTSTCISGPGAAQASPRIRAASWATAVSFRRLHMQADPSTTTTPISDAPDAPDAPDALDASDPPSKISPPTKSLPKQCHGCGALSQTTSPGHPGYFDLGRKNVRRYLGVEKEPTRPRNEDKVYEDVLKQLNMEELEKQGVDVEALAYGLRPAETQPQRPPKKPLCDRCHYLFHNNTAESIYHPSVEAIHDTLLESPYKYNHVYHVLDAADFPMSLLDKVEQLLDTMPLRSKNRRSKTGRFYHGKKTEMSFIITRTDLLAPTNAQVDAIFPYLREVLREVLDRTGSGIRLGNVLAVSAKRGWWVGNVKNSIWERGGATWLVGKANVGKSQLFEAIFPKGRMNWDPSPHQITVDMEAKTKERLAQLVKSQDAQDEYSLLPPAPEETQYPEMPLVSELPGTTASPIRVPFGNGRGELIDLPGLERSALENYVKKEHRSSLLMHSRIVPEQQTLRPGRSLLLGGFIRITPREPATTILAYAFTPITPHVCRTEKAISIQNQTGEINVENIALPGTEEITKHAKSFQLKWDVTKQRAGPLTRKNAVNLDVERLPFRVLSTDILIEGVGWVELVAQVRAKDLFAPRPRSQETEMEVDTEQVGTVPGRKLSAFEEFEALGEGGKQKVDDDPHWPIVDVYTPEGRFVSARKPMNGWLMNKPRVTAASKRSRPRRSMKGVKKLAKKREREAAATWTT